MLQLTFPSQGTSALNRILCLGAHSDDIEIGCGGTILKLMETYPTLTVCWVVFSGTGKRKEEAIASAETFLKKAGERKIIVKDFRDGFFPYMGVEIKEYFEQLKREISPDLIFTHYRHDLHQDHQLISKLTWNTFRNHLILEYEIPKYDGDLGNPNVFVHLSESICQQKFENLMTHFATQANKHWFNEGTFSAILTLRGIESNAPDKYAESFYCRKLVFS